VTHHSIRRTAGALLALLACAGCDSRTPWESSPPPRPDVPQPAPPTAVAHACLADSARPLTRGGSEREGCTATDLGCRDACLAGDASSCYHRALELEKDETGRSEAFVLHHRACELGLAIGCTNYAAALWAGESSPDQESCARRLFTVACDVKEPFACGMLGRMMLDDASGTEDIQLGRSVLERSCEELGGFPCRVLAKHLESGQLGPSSAVRVQSLLLRACEGGDEDACGKHRTALETFSE
jgi:hypothetical protein